MSDPTLIEDALERAIARASQTALATEAEVAAYERERHESLRREMLDQCGIEPLLDVQGIEAVVRDACEQTDALRMVRQWLAGRIPVLVLLSDPGLGKTVSAAWALTRHAGLYQKANELARLRSSFEPADQDAWKRYLRSGLLVVDELGVEDRGAKEMLGAVIDARQRPSRRTLLLSNLSRVELERRYDARMLDRLRAIGVFRSIRGASMRKSLVEAG